MSERQQPLRNQNVLQFILQLVVDAETVHWGETQATRSDTHSRVHRLSLDSTSCRSTNTLSVLTLTGGLLQVRHVPVEGPRCCEGH